MEALVAESEFGARQKAFDFGENWRRYLEHVDEERIAVAQQSLAPLGSLAGLTFLDLGCGSGLFSLAALRQGAARVVSVDRDPKSVACAHELKRRFANGDERWEIREGDVLDEEGMEALGNFDVVYSWGVLHHTGDLARSLNNASAAVADGGQLFLAIYNAQGWKTRYWKLVKRGYNSLPAGLRIPYIVTVMAPREALLFAVALARGEPGDYLASWTRYKAARGMSRWHDLVDWVGGYPFEVAAPDAIFQRFRAEGYVLKHLKTCGGSLGCNEFVFVRSDQAP